MSSLSSFSLLGAAKNLPGKIISNLKGEGDGEGDTDRSTDKSKPGQSRNSVDAERSATMSTLPGNDPSNGIASALAAMALRRERANGAGVTQHRMAKFTKLLSAQVVSHLSLILLSVPHFSLVLSFLFMPLHPPLFLIIR